MSRVPDGFFIDSSDRQEKWRLEDSLNLLPSENMTSPAVRSLLASDFGHRYTLPVNAEYAGEFLENSYRGTRITTEVELAAERIAAEVFKARYACVQPLSGHIAAMIVIKSLTRRGDKILSVGPDCGGYDGYAKEYLPDIFALEAMHLPFDRTCWNVKAKESARQILKHEPRLVILGASFILFPYEIAPIRDACNEVGAFLAYDGSHVLGLIAGGEFQKPLKEGADILYGSTHKSFFGPQGGLIVTNDPNIDKELRKNLTWRIVDNVHWNRVAALGQALVEARKFGARYAKQVVRNSKRLGEELDERGFPVNFAKLGYTVSHQLQIDKRGVKKRYGLSVNDFSVRMEKSNMIIDSVARLGTAELTRIGVKEKHIPDIVDLFMLAADGKNVKSEVKRLRARFAIDFA